MCPDRQIVSLFADGELPSPWREKLLAHADACPSCTTLLSNYRSVSAALARPAADEAMEAAKARVWRELSAVRVVRPGIAAGRSTSVWHRSLVLPWPAAVAAVLVVAIAAAFIGAPAFAPNDRAIARLGSDVQPVVPVADMDGVLRYLESQESSADILIIRLPDSKDFLQSGEPALVRAADYVRSVGR
ncbi:MAG TPA: hypothetical protein DIC34_17475 [Treponema sp.]|nr:MAG: hypothetical protein A2001_15280 [Treponema sp. GWC1_61_84]HCM28292.1 hypothetical protein [Treponema sp.]